TCAASIAYRHALKDPVNTVEDAKEAMQIIANGVHRLASLPRMAETEHKKFQKAIQTMIKGKSSPMQMLEEGLKIYGNTGHWLHMGMPEIMEGIEHGIQHGTEVSKESIDKVYQKWRAFGVKHAEPKNANSPAQEHLGLFKEKTKPLAGPPSQALHVIYMNPTEQLILASDKIVPDLKDLFWKHNLFWANLKSCIHISFFRNIIYFGRI
ncbi:MAG: hypothetical protein WCO49_20030, partial [Nostocales cyanobacterium ELA608]